MSLSRRDFLKASGALIVSFGAPSFAQGPFDTHPSHIDPTKLDSWIAVASDGTVTAYTGKCDMGQGMFTVQTQLVAEELCVPLERVKLIQCDTAVCPDQGTTSGSQSTPTNFNDEGLAQAAASAREALVKMAAQRLGDDAKSLRVEAGVVIAKSGARASYAELIGNRHFEIAVNNQANRRTAAEWKVLGKPVLPIERAALMTGQFEFVHNVRVPGMLHGRVVRPAAVGATVVSVDEGSVAGLPGVVKVVRRDNFVGVVAEKPWQAMEAARRLKVQWTTPPPLPPQETFFGAVRKLPARDSLLVDSKDVEPKLKAAHKQAHATYIYPYQAHGSIGSSCAVADVKPTGTTIWSATQSVYPTRSCVAKLLNIPLESVRVVYVRGSGCYGLNGADTVSFDAALLSNAVKRPVRVQLSRQDEMAWENYGSPIVLDQRAGLDAAGNIVAWDIENWVPSRGSRPRYDKPGNVITGFLVGFEPDLVRPLRAQEPTGKLRNNSNAVPSYFAGYVEGKRGGAGTIRGERVLSHTVPSPFFTGPLRSPLRIQNTFGHECFMDELALLANADPVAFRLKHLSDRRLADAVRAAAKLAKWQPRTSHARQHTGGVATGQGVACMAYEGDNGYAAVIAEVRVDIATGAVTPTRFFVAIDAGPISNPDGLRNQTEGGVLQGMSRALVEEVTWNDHRVTSYDWSTYTSLSLGIEVPSIEIALLNRTDVPATGAGETAITAVPAAIGNAIFDACGARVRQVPFTPERVKAAIAQKERT